MTHADEIVSHISYVEGKRRRAKDDYLCAKSASLNCQNHSGHAGRIRDHRFVADFFRLFLRAAALNLSVRLRRPTTKAPTAAELGILEPVPAAALSESSKTRFVQRRRRHDPLGEGQPCTWCSRLIKVAVEVIVSSRRVLVKLSSRWPHRDELFRIGGQIVHVGSS